MPILLYIVGETILTAGLIVVSYLDRVYRELGRASRGQIHEHLEAFEAEIEPRFKMDRARAGLAFSLLARFWIVVVTTITALGIVYFEPDRWQTVLEIVLLLGAEVVIAMQLVPLLLLAGTNGRWGAPLVPPCPVRGV